MDRAISLLAAFQPGDKALTLTQLSERTRLYNSTVLRLLASLAHGRLVRRTSDGAWALGPEVARLASIYSASFSLQDVVVPEMRALMERTQESVAFHVRQGDVRLVLFRVDSPQPLRDHVHAGDLLPLTRGAGGRVLLAYAGARGRICEQIRRDGYVMLTGDRIPGLTGISAPVWRAGGELVGALTLTVPEQRVKASFVADLCASAARLTAALGGSRPEQALVANVAERSVRVRVRRPKPASRVRDPAPAGLPSGRAGTGP